MCSIVGSFNLDILASLASLNEYRGTHSNSISIFTEEPSGIELQYISKQFGKLDIENVIEQSHRYKNPYFICHQQAPTTSERDIDSIHPAIIDRDMLWHNGIIKQNCVESLQAQLETTAAWDTKLLLDIIQKTKSFNALSTIDGSFSCVYYNGLQKKLYLFRNDISPMYYDSELNISSTIFKNSTSLQSNNVFEINPFKNSLTPIETFQTFDNPYYFGD